MSLGIGVLLGMAGVGGGVQAQIATDGRLTGSAVALSGPHFAIGPHLGRQVGGNLFHSFASFNLAGGQSATFSGPAGVGNIVSRVTGAAASSIDGTLRSTIAGANLFLINPRGILFGPNASLDLSGSFYASTANYLRLADGGRFDASDPAGDVLTAAPPAAFGFLGPAAADVRLLGTQLAAPKGASIGLVGGALRSRDGASIATAGGDIALIAANGRTEVGVGAPTVPVAHPLAAIELRSSAIHARSDGDLPPGRIVIRGGQIEIADTTIHSSNGSNRHAGGIDIAATGDLRQHELATVRSDSSAAGNAADIRIAAAGTYSLVSTPDTAWAEVWTEASGSGRAGAIALSADVLRLVSSNVYSINRSSADAGAISLTGRIVDIADGNWVYSESRSEATSRGAPLLVSGSERVSVHGRDWGGASAAVFSNTGGAGHAGDIVIGAPHIDFRNAYVYSETWASGHAGNVALAGRAIDVVGSHVFSKTYGEGNAGHMSFSGDTIRFVGGEGAITFVDTTVADSSGGNGGNIEVRANVSLELSRADYPDDWTRLSTSSFSTGRAGDITVSAPAISIRDGASIWSGTFHSGRGGDIRISGDEISVRARGKIESIAHGEGRGGDIDIVMAKRFFSSEDIRVPVDAHTEMGTYSYTTGRGDAGHIRIHAPEITLVGGSVHSMTYGQGNSGTLTFEGEVIRFLGGNDNVVSLGAGASNHTSGNGGDVLVRASQRFELNGTGFPQDWSAVGVATQGTGRSGVIDIRAPEILIEDASLFSRTRFSTGAGGDIVLDAARITIRTGGEVFAGTEGVGRGGSIRINATERLVMDTPEAFTPSTWWPAANGSARIYASTLGPGRAGDVSITTPELFGNFGARIVSATVGTGDAGNILLEADRVRLTGYSSIDTSSEAGGNAGSITLRISESLQLTERTPGGAFGPRAHGVDFREQPAVWRGGIATRSLGTGNAGDVSIDAASILLDDARILTSTWQSGRGGHTAIRADSVVLRNGAQIDAKSNTGSTGDAGAIVLDLAGRLEVAGMSPVDGAFSGINAETLGSGRGGDIRIAAPHVSVDRGFIRSSTGGSGRAGNIEIRSDEVALLSGGAIDAGTAATSSGDGGAIDVRASRAIVVRGIDLTPQVAVSTPTDEVIAFSGLTAGRRQGAAPSAVSSSTAGSGAGGNVTLSAPQITIADGAKVSANSSGGGNAGNIAITAPDWLRLYSGSVTTQAEAADGGNIDIVAGNMIRLVDAQVSTSVEGGQGSGGNIFIDPTFVILESSRLSADAVGGAGGNVSLFADVFLASPDSSLSASSRLGLPGRVQISALQSGVITALPALPAQFLDPSRMLREACTPRAAGSRLVHVGRGGVAGWSPGYSPSSYFADALGIGAASGLVPPTSEPPFASAQAQPPSLRVASCKS